jgi:hypothetical protein
MTSQAERILTSIRWELPSCANCEKLSTSMYNINRDTPRDTPEFCTLDPQKRLPPVKIIAYGCPAFVLDLPF